MHVDGSTRTSSLHELVCNAIHGTCSTALMHMHLHAGVADGADTEDDREELEEAADVYLSEAPGERL